MAALKLRPGKICSAEQVKKIRSDLQFSGPFRSERFLLRGEIAIADEFLSALSDDADPATKLKAESLKREKVNSHPANYPAQAFFDVCREIALRELEPLLNAVCLDPASDLSAGPWYFPNLFTALLDFLNDYTRSKNPKFATAIGKKISEVLDYTAYSGGLTLMQGEARTGKTFAARAWCDQRPGNARFIEVPPGNDEVGFFRALARGLGLGNFLKYKSCDIRDRVESVLLTRDILLVLDEAQRLWPQRNLRYGFPHRIVWLMTMANAGVPIAMVATPQFIETQKAVERSGWNSRQLIGRIKHYESLPPELSHEDLAGVTRAVLPEASDLAVNALATYARNSARYLAAVDSIASRARYLAMKDGRDVAAPVDVQRAIKESVIPADSKLQSALAAVQPLKRARLSPVAQLHEGKPFQRQNEFSAPRERSTTPAAETPIVGV
ncbi:MAG TPA: ATP-binding protein [Verrucomicrobiae bacterium]|nr:ATP-binding protein [Verrucomicrobiae bacterium]